MQQDQPDHHHPIYQSLSLFEETYLPGRAGRRGPSALFIVQPPWGIQRDLLGKGILACSKIPGLQIKHLLSLRFSAQKTCVSLAATPDAFQAKENMSRLRAFYLPRDDDRAVCVKIMEMKGVSSTRADTEIRQRQMVEQYGTISLPRIGTHGFLGNYMYIVEEMILGRRFRYGRDLGLFIRAALPELIRTYQAHGIKRGVITDCFSPGLPRALLDVDGGNETLGHMAALLDHAFAGRHGVDLSLCHGDLLASNLCVAQGKIWFLDWDKSHDGPLVPDLLRLAMKNPKKADRLLHAIRHALSAIIKEDPGPVFTATIAKRIVDVPHQRAALLALWRKHYPAWHGSPEPETGHSSGMI